MPIFPLASHLSAERRVNEMAHWIYVLWAANALVGVTTWPKATLAIVRLVLMKTGDPDRAARCAEILRLARKDAKDLPSYLAPPNARTRRASSKRPPEDWGGATPFPFMHDDLE
jgi:hypothetical protein